MPLTTAEAERALQAAKAKALQLGVKVGISVVDARGDLITMVRLDGAPWRTPVISRAKAVAAACFGIPSGELQERALTPVIQAMMMTEGGHMVPGKGALPIIRRGEVLGAIGTSGGTADQDEEIARAGVSAI